MEFVIWVILGILLLVSFFLLRNKLSSNKKYRFPPGPRGLPLIGSPWFMLKELHVVFTDLSRVWGDVMYVNILGQQTVVFNSAEWARRAFVPQVTGMVCAGRPAVSKIDSHIIHSTTFSCPSPLWSKQRKLIHRILNMHGEGVQETEDVIHEELSHVTEWLEKSKGAVNLDDVISSSLISILTILLKGVRYDYGLKVPANVQLMDERFNQIATAGNLAILANFPFLMHLPLGVGKRVQEFRKTTSKFDEDFFEENEATYDPHVTRGMIDYLLHHQAESRQNGEQIVIEDESIKSMTIEVIAGGSVTSRGALDSFFLIILHKPEVARRIQEEIDAVIGRDRRVRVEDRPDMPYTMAAIFELLRYISHVPLGIPHVTTEDCEVGEYYLPKGTMLLANSWCFHHDKTVWPDPWEFKPERFLDNNNKLVSADHPSRKNLLPFGVGRRSCVGETFARTRIFLFIVTLLQKFDFSRDSTRPLPSCDPRSFHCALVLFPQQYCVTVTSRD